MSEEREEKEDLPAEVTEPSESDSSGEGAGPESVSADPSDESVEADPAEGSKSPDADESPEAETSEAETSDSSPGDEAEVALPGEGTPEGERLREAMRAFERGDYAAVRSITESLVSADGADPEVIGAAAELRARLDVDPMQLVVLGGCLIFFAWIVYTYVWT